MFLDETVSPPPKVSVCIVTYNHEKFAAQAIESVLVQQTDFDYELVIGDDCSTDDTRSIAQGYRSSYPEKIRLLLPEKNLGPLTNFWQTLQACRGRYVALLEGDDYWTCPRKLQKQVDFLGTHDEYAFCFHNATEIYENGEREPWDYCAVGMKQTLTLRDLLVSNFIPTCSVVFQRGLFTEFPDWYFRGVFGDWPLHILNAQHGNIRYIDEVMGVHRNHPGGIWSSRDSIRIIEEMIRFYGVINDYLGSRYDAIISTQVSKLYYDMAMTYCFRKNYRSARRFLLKGLLRKPLNKHMLSWDLLRTCGRSILNTQWIVGNRVEQPH